MQNTFQYKPGPFIGSPETVADALQHRWETKAADGFVLHLRLTEDVERFIDTVIPILRARGLYRTEYEADTLRGNLGIPFPANRHSLEPDLVDA